MARRTIWYMSAKPCIEWYMVAGGRVELPASRLCTFPHYCRGRTISPSSDLIGGAQRVVSRGSLTTSLGIALR